MVDWVRKYRSPLKENLGAKISIAFENLEGGDVGLKFQLKVLDFMDSVNQKPKCGKKKKAYKTK